MKNRIRDYPPPTSDAENSETTIEEWRNAAQTQFNDRKEQIEKYVRLQS